MTVFYGAHALTLSALADMPLPSTSDERPALTASALPHARYIVVAHEGVWKINLDNRYFGPFTTRDEAVESATKTARQASESGYPASVLVMEGAAFETVWDSSAEA